MKYFRKLRSPAAIGTLSLLLGACAGSGGGQGPVLSPPDLPKADPPSACAISLDASSVAATARSAYQMRQACRLTEEDLNQIVN